MKLFLKIVLMLFILFLSLPLFTISPDKRMDYWKTQKKGTNSGTNTKYTPQWFKAAAEAGFQFIRFNTSDLPANEEQFLIGNFEHFEKINEADLKVLIGLLDEAHKNDLKIIFAMFTLPGCIYDRENTIINDSRLWQSEKYQEQTFNFWKQLVKAIKDHPAIVGYNPFNEPHPEKMEGHEHVSLKFRKWLHQTKNTPADLNRFNRRVVEAIREVDPHTPIFLDGYFYAAPYGMPFLEPVDDQAVIYTFHNPAPWQFTVYKINNGRYRYPDKMTNRWNGPGRKWTIHDLAALLKPVEKFIKKNNIPSYRIAATEFWCDRRIPGCREYFSDLIQLYNNKKWHWAFYGFRGEWDGLDYELGSQPMGPDYWRAIQNGTHPESLKKRKDNPIWDVLKKEFAGK